MSEVLTVKARDADSEQNARISYRLYDKDLPFDIHSVSGITFVNARLDREIKAEYQLIVIAFDHGNVRFILAYIENAFS